MAKQYVSAAKAHFDLLHSRKDPFHYKAGTLGLEAISKRGGGGEGHSKVIHQLWLTVWGGARGKPSSFILGMAANLPRVHISYCRHWGKRKKVEAKRF